MRRNTGTDFQNRIKIKIHRLDVPGGRSSDGKRLTHLENTVYFKKLAVAIGVLSLAVSIHAAKTPLHVPGLGMTLCEQVAKVDGTDQGQGTKRLELHAWAQGFFSGLMIAHAQQFVAEFTEVEGTPISIVYDSSEGWVSVVEYCHENGSDSFAEAVMAVMVVMVQSEDD